MFDFNDMKATIIPLEEFKYRFIGDIHNEYWYVSRKDVVIEGECETQVKRTNMYFIARVKEIVINEVIELQEDNGTLLDKDIVEEFIKFKETRPEYYYTKPVLNTISVFEDLIKVYDIIFAGAILVRANTDEAIPQIEKCLKWLHSTDFYSAPGSTIYHDAFLGGLLSHTLDVVERIRDLLNTTSFSTVNPEDAIIVALVHDWCKIGSYESYMRNVKDDITKKWNEVPAFRVKDVTTLPTDLLLLKSQGHGEASEAIASRYIRLSPEQSLAIRWHMGEYQCVNELYNQLQCANENFPLVHLIQFADRLAITNY